MGKFALMAACFGLFAVSAVAGESVIIGVMGPVTGPWASEGEDMVNVVNIMAKEINAAGGINGRTIQIEVGDDAGDPRTAALAAQRLISSEVIAVVGTYGSSICEAAQGIYDDEGVLQIATGSTSIRLSEQGYPLFFRTCPRDDEQGIVMAGKVADMGHKRIAILHDNTSYAKGLADESRGNFEKLGLDIVFFDAVTPGDRDFTTTLVKMRTAEPDIVVFTAYYPEAAMILRQKKDMRWDIPMIGGDATNNSVLVEIAGVEAANGYYFISPPGPMDLTGPAAVKLLDEYRARHNAVPSSVWAMMAGDAFGVIVEALKHIEGEPTSESIAGYLHNELENYPGFTGTISFNEKGDRIGDVYRLYQVNDKGEFVLVQ
ncbi:MAG: branched-chain amino acid ABC transporter substrate-binding protein [Planctomycetota bacterium]|jgi:branched-chain amino acid transport system substrate-binding protein|nr:branched-chain amino acid ABC transporter substrate-binding protein [Planctomycetota bacterium]